MITVTMNLSVNHVLDDISNHHELFAIIPSSGRFLAQSHRSTGDPANSFVTFPKSMLREMVPGMNVTKISLKNSKLFP